jgi:hypothetical protein
MKSLVLLVGGSLLVWAALAYPGWVLWGEAALVHSAVAWLLCVVPGAITVAWALRREQAPEMRVVAVLGGSGIRLAAALGGGLVLTELLPETFTKVFWLWVGVFYAVLLTLEVLLLVRQQKSASTM